MSSQLGVDKRYWFRRSDMMYYKYIDILVKAFAYDAKSIIDVGSANTQYIESFYWIPNKYTLDIKSPYGSPNVTAIEEDFLNFTPESKFDFATCLQVLEHIPDVEQFAKKLFDISDKVLISVPYLWPKDAEIEHVNDPVDEEKLKEWTGREPSYSIIVSEPLRIPSKGISKRMICYYGPDDEKLNYKKLQENVKLLQEKEQIGNELMVNSFSQNMELINEIKQNLNNVREEQKRYFEMMRKELKEIIIDNELEHLVKDNRLKEEKLLQINREIDEYENLVFQTKNEREQIQIEIDKLLESSSWKATKPLRVIGKVFKKQKR